MNDVPSPTYFTDALDTDVLVDAADGTAGTRLAVWVAGVARCTLVALRSTVALVADTVTGVLTHRTTSISSTHEPTAPVVHHTTLTSTALIMICTSFNLYNAIQETFMRHSHWPTCWQTIRPINRTNINRLVRKIPATVNVDLSAHYLSQQNVFGPTCQSDLSIDKLATAYYCNNCST